VRVIGGGNAVFNGMKKKRKNHGRKRTRKRELRALHNIGGKEKRDLTEVARKRNGSKEKRKKKGKTNRRRRRMGEKLYPPARENSRE